MPSSTENHGSPLTYPGIQPIISGLPSTRSCLRLGAVIQWPRTGGIACEHSTDLMFHRMILSMLKFRAGAGSFDGFFKKTRPGYWSGVRL